MLTNRSTSTLQSKLSFGCKVEDSKPKTIKERLQCKDKFLTSKSSLNQSRKHPVTSRNSKYVNGSTSNYKFINSNKESINGRHNAVIQLKC